MLSHNVYKSCCCILISSLCPNVVDIRIVHVKLELDDAIIKDRFASNIQDIRYFV